jgi:glucose-6-phosphate 1-epimerase
MSVEEVTDFASGLIKYRLCVGSHSAEVFAHGAHVTSWRVAGDELLFVSSKALFAPPKAIRGGVPICWPQFSDLGPLGQHGFARNLAWALVSGGAEENGVFAELRLSDSDATRQAGWLHSFELSLRVQLQASGVLALRLTCINTGASAFDFTTALHTYFRCNARAAAVLGLRGSTYRDSLEGRKPVTEQAEAVRFAGEVDRMYMGVLAPGCVVTLDAARRVSIQAAGLPDAVVWNPWVAKAAAMADYGDDEWQDMVCIEAALLTPSSLAASQHWNGELIMTPLFN